MQKIHKINAENKILGRVASKAAYLLTGKNKTDFSYNKPTGDKVVIINAAKIKFSGKKLENKKYITHSGYLGNIKYKSLKELYYTNPQKIVINAISGMLPDNKLKKKFLKNLTVYKGEESDN